MKEKLSKFLGEPIIDIQKLFGEASYRVYYRIFTQSGKTSVLMEMPKGKKMSASEEITNLKQEAGSRRQEELPYINIQRYLKSIGLPVPEIRFFSKAEGWIILEDLGDTKLEDIVSKAKPGELISWYKKAIDLLIEIQTKTSPNYRTIVPSTFAKATADKSYHRTSCVAFDRSFDATLFNWEFDHFWKYCVLRSDKNKYEEETRKITEELCQLPQGFTHRDYQSRNLMVKENQLYIIDFQDALLGPKIYDVVCLLRDSYIDLTPHLETLLHYYCEKSGENFGKTQQAFDLQTIQRKLKDAGRFVYIDRMKKNPNFLKHIPASLGYVRQALERLPEYRELYDLLKKYVEEWNA